MTDYGYKVVYPDSGRLISAGFSEVARLPFLFDGRPSYARLPNRFLIDIGMGYWEPSKRGQIRNPIPPSRKSMRSYAYALANALEWAFRAGLALLLALVLFVTFNDLDGHGLFKGLQRLIG